MEMSVEIREMSAENAEITHTLAVCIANCFFHSIFCFYLRIVIAPEKYRYK